MALTVKALEDLVSGLDARIAALEALAASNKGRLDAIDQRAQTNTADVDGVKAWMDRQRWLQTLRRR